ncbi:hypothetical protein DV736_g3920, partial [Chaetothyriales sp. CBS 134916]
MDINSLLSPSDTPRSSSGLPLSPVSHTPVAHTRRPPARHVTAKATGMPTLIKALVPPPSIPAHILSSSQAPGHASPLIAPMPTSSALTPQLPRAVSTPSIEALVDLASTQIRSPTMRSPLSRLPLSSHLRTSFDIAMVETPREMLRSDFSGSSLPAEKQRRLSELVAHIQETPSSSEAHMEIIGILHQGFVDHIYPSNDPSARRDPRAYGLLDDLRQARENADKLFALGEDQWLDWVQDESLLAQSAEERVEVIEKCKRAIDEEYGSPRLWSTYGDWLRHCYDWAHQGSSNSSTEMSQDAERLLGRELFTWESVVEVWEQGADQTSHDMAQSHLVWDKFIRARFPKLDQKMFADQAKQAMAHFLARLQTPHARWEPTFQTFSSFVSANYTNEDYEQIMGATTQAAAAAKSLWSSREGFESTLASAISMGDEYAQYQAFMAYVEWEKDEEQKVSGRKNRGKRKNAVNEIVESGMLIHALYERAELRFPSVVSLWEDHVRFLIQHDIRGVRSVLARATKHCPRSGSLWKQRLLSAEIADESFDQVEAIKHSATKSGILDAAGIEQVLQVHNAWCGYLLRRTRKGDSMEEDADVAEMGMRASIEAIQSLASKLDLGENFDPSFRLQRKYIEYLKGQGRLDNAGKQFDDAIPTYGKHYRFWLRFYEFEMQKSLHINSLQQDSRHAVSLNSSSPFAVAILKQGLEHQDLDYPEYLIEALLNHCEDYEDADELQAALVLTAQVQKRLSARRELEAAAAAAAAKTVDQAATESTALNHADAVVNDVHIGKRKRDDELEVEDEPKRVKSEEHTISTIEAPQESVEELKRDREHASILVHNLPENLPDMRLRQYFSSCGSVQSVRNLHDDDHSYIIEFREAEEAQYALSRDGQELDGSILSVVLNTGSTLYVTNYPPAADEALIRQLFKPYGDIVSVRFPSLQGNKRRRFCYVEFKSSDQAQTALELNGREVQGLAMTVKISNPALRKQRYIALNQANVVFVGQLPFRASEDELTHAFAGFGDIEQVRMPRDVQNKSRNKGIAFITYKTAESAQSALGMDGTDFLGRKIKVNLADDQGQTQSRRHVARSNSPNPKFNGDTTSSPPASVEVRRQRTVVLADVPDTVNESRIKAVANKFGTVVKVMLRTNHQGALVEFEDAADAGKASLKLDGFEINPGRKIRVTTEKDMMAQKPEKKMDKIGGKVPPKAGPGPGPVNAPIRRPQQPGTGTGRKGGNLGQRSAAVFETEKAEHDELNRDQNGVVVKKSNDDFRALLNNTR